MKRDFLKNLGIEDKNIIDQILDENSADIGRAKGELDTYKTRITNLENDIKTKDNEISRLTKETGDVNSLNKRISQLETDKSNLTNELNTKVAQMQKAHDTENKVRDRKAKNVKAVMALLDMDKDIDEQLEALTKGDDTAFLFGDVSSPVGTHANTPHTGGNGGTPPTSTNFVDAITKALTKN